MKLDKKIVQIIRKYKRLLEQKMPIEQVIVFGSQVKGTAHKWSDIDVAVVSPKLGQDRHDEGVMLSRFVDDVDLRIEPHPYHPRDLKDKWDPLAAEIRKHGIPVI